MIFDPVRKDLAEAINHRWYLLVHATVEQRQRPIQRVDMTIPGSIRRSLRAPIWMFSQGVGAAIFKVDVATH